MNREDVMRMAREARLAEHTHPYELWSASDDGLERFANLVAAAEREACANVAAWILKMPENDVSAAIRARGTDEQG
jgi:hypothetical protein